MTGVNREPEINSQTMEAAQRLYESMGFKPATSYYVNPLPNVKYFSLDLRKG